MGRTVLIVDDEPDIRELAALSLERIGRFEVITASTAAEALEHLAADAPDAVLLDVMMPGADGRETLRRIRATGARVPVVFLTASVQEDQMEELRALDVHGVLAKPFDPLTLPDELREVLGWR